MSLTIGGEYNESIVSYIFHHNLRAIDWDDPRVQKDGFHPKVYIDAGGHRSMYGPGEEVDLVTLLLVAYSMYGEDYLNNSSLPNLTADIIDWIVSQEELTLDEAIDDDGSPQNDEVIGFMTKAMWLKGTLAEWRGEDTIEVVIVAGTPYPVPTKNADWESGGSDKTLKVEDFENWVWVYGVEEDTTDIEDRVSFTGDNIYLGEKMYLWPNNGIHLPWRSEKSWAMEDPNTGKLISSTELVWNWWAYDYAWNGALNPSATTRYYDGS